MVHSIRQSFLQLLHERLRIGPLLGLAFFFAAQCTFSQQPIPQPLSTARVVPWHGRISGRANQSVRIVFSIYDSPQGGSPLWTEEQELRTGADGGYDAFIGNTASPPLSPDLFPVNQPRWLQISEPPSPEDSAAKPNSAVVPTRVLLAPAMTALHAEDSDLLGGHPASDYALRAEIPNSQTPANGVSADPLIASHGRDLRPLDTTPLAVSAGGTGSAYVTGALANLGAQPLLPGLSAVTGKNEISESGGILSLAINSATINGIVSPAACLSDAPPAWCTGSTADADIRAACLQLPVHGGIIDLRGYGATTQVLAAPISGCMSPSKKVVFYVDNATRFLITEHDGGITFPFDNSSGIVGAGVGQCVNASDYQSGFVLDKSANLTAIFGPAHLDGSQESLFVSSICASGATGATVSRGLVYFGYVYSNTALMYSFLTACNNSCLFIENSGGIINVIGDEMSGAFGNYQINSTPLVVWANSATQGPGLLTSDINIEGTNLEHGNGSGCFPYGCYAAANITGDDKGGIVGNISIRHGHMERSSKTPKGLPPQPPSIALRLHDCWTCRVEGMSSSGGDGRSFGQSLIQISESSAKGIRDITLSDIQQIAYPYQLLIENDVEQDPVAAVNVPTQPSTISQYKIKPGYIRGVSSKSDVSSTYLTPPPVIAVPSGNFSSSFSTTIADSTPNAMIYLTLTDSNGHVTNFSGPSPLPVSIGQSYSLSAYALAPGWSASSSVGANYSLRLPMPAISGCSLLTQNRAPCALTLTASAGAAIYFTTDGSTPSPGQGTTQLFQKSVTLAATAKVQTVATKSGWSDSPVAYWNITF